MADQLRDTHALVARYGNAIDDTTDHFWDGRQTFVQEVLDAETVVEKMAYVMANPVHHRLVAKPSAWEGLLTKVHEIGVSGLKHTRPAEFFADGGNVPNEVTLDTVIPPMCMQAFGAEGFRRRVTQAVNTLVEQARAEVRREGQKVLGMGGVRAIGRMDRPATPTQRQSGQRAAGGRRVAATRPSLITEALTRIKLFRVRYRQALEVLRKGVTAPLFPLGTWLVCQFFGAKREKEQPLEAAAA